MRLPHTHDGKRPRGLEGIPGASAGPTTKPCTPKISNPPSPAFRRTPFLGSRATGFELLATVCRFVLYCARFTSVSESIEIECRFQRKNMESPETCQPGHTERRHVLRHGRSRTSITNGKSGRPHPFLLLPMLFPSRNLTINTALERAPSGDRNVPRPPSRP